MSDSISQDEIDALIRGTLGGSQQSDSLTTAQTEVLNGAVDRFLGEAAAAAAALLGTSVSVTSPQSAQCTAQSVTDRIGFPIVVGRLVLSGKVAGPVYLAMPESAAMQFLTQLYGGEAPESIGDLELGAMAEGFSQMAGPGLTVISGMAGGAVNLEPATAVHAADFPEGSGLSDSDQVYCCETMMSIGDSADPVVLVLPLATARSLAEAATPRPAASPAQPAAKPAQPAQQAVASAGAPAVNTSAGEPVAYESATFKDLSPQAQRGAQPAPAPPEIRNIDLLLDVNLEVTVELGRTRRRIRDVLTLGPGSIVEIDKLAGEAVDVLVNGKLIAKGEVVIIDDNYGVRISDIISPVERVQSLK